MPDAGKVTIDVDLGALNLGDKLTNAVHRAVIPAITRAQTALDGFSRSADSVDGQGFKRAANAIDEAGAAIRRAGQDGRSFASTISNILTGSGGAPGGGLPGLRKEVANYHGVLGQVRLGIDKFFASLVGLGAQVGTVVPVIGALGGAIGVLGGGIGIALGGIGQLIAGVAALGPAIGGIVAAVKIGFSGLEDGAKAYLAQFDNANKVLSAQIGNLMGPLLTAWEEVSSRIKLDFAQALVPTFNNLAALLRTIGPDLSKVAEGFAGVANNVTATLNAAGPQIQAILAGSRTLIDTIGPGIQVFAKGVLDLGASAQAAMPQIAGAIRGALTQVGDQLGAIAASPAFQQALSGFADTVSSVGNVLSNLLPTLIQLGATVGPQFANMLNSLVPLLVPILDAFGQIATTAGPLFIQFLAGAGPILGQFVLDLGRLGEVVGPTLLPLLQALGDAVHAFIEPLGQAGANLAVGLTTLLPSLGELIAAVAGPLAVALPSFGTALKVVADAIVATGPLIVVIGEQIGTIITALATGLEPLIPVIGQLAESLTPLITIIGNVILLGVQNLGTIIEAAAPLLIEFFQMLGDSLRQVQPQIDNFITQLGQVLPDFLSQALPLMTEMFRAMQPHLQTVIDLMAQLLPIVIQIAPRFLELGLNISERLLPFLPALLGPLAEMALHFAHLADALGFVINKMQQLWDLIEDSPLGLLVGPLGKIAALAGEGGRETSGSSFGPSGSSFGPSLGTQIRKGIRRGGPVIALPPPPTLFAGPGAYTPVLPDLGGGGGGGGAGVPTLPTLPIGDRPLVVQTPEQEKLLTDIKKLLEGTGNASAPLNALKDLKPAVSQIAQDLKKTLPASKLPPGAVGTRMGPFGTPIKAYDPAYEAAAAAVNAAGGNAELFLGQNPIDYAQEKWEKEVDSWKTTADNQIDAWQAAVRLQDQLNQKLATALQGSAGQTAIPGMPWTGQVPSAAPIAVTGTDKASLAKSIFSAITGAGYAPQVGLGAVAASLLESGLDPNIVNATGHKGLFQMSADKRPGDAAAQIAWFVNELGKQGGPGAANQDPLNFIADKIEKGGYPGSDYQKFLDQAAKLIGSGGAPMALPTTTNPMPVALVDVPSILKDTGSVPSGPASRNAAALIQQMWGAQIRGSISGSRDTNTAPGTHDTGTSIDIPIGADQKALGDQINAWLQANAQQLGLKYSIWQDVGRNVGGGTFNASGHTDHIDAHFTGMPTSPGLPGTNIATSGAPIPVFVTNWPGAPAGPAAPGAAGAGGFPGSSILGAGFNAASSATQSVTGDVIDAIANVGLENWRKRAPNADLQTLVQQRNPLAFASALGFDVQDFTRQGGEGGAAGPAAPFDASGRLFSDTAALVDRSFTSLAAKIDAMREQLLDVLNQVRQAVSEQVLKPIIQSAIDTAFRELSTATTSSIGKTLGSAAAGPIADAVGKAMPPPAAAPGGLGNVVSAITGFDTGGEWPTNTLGLNLTGGTEYVLTPDQYKTFATVGGVVGNATVGSEFFGLSQVPILGMIINILIEVLLAIIGVEIKVRDTLQELTGEFRGFRGDTMQYFDAEGRMLNDTSALIERSLSSAQISSDERTKILSDVIAGTIQFVVTQVVIPVGKAVANAAIDAGASAAGGAVTAASFGAPFGGQAVSALISSAGHAGVEIAGDIATTFVNAATPVLTDAVFAGIQGIFPGLVRGIFSGAGAATLFDPLGKFLAAILGGGLIGPGAWGSVGDLFDSGGMAYGTGLMPKATIKPERVLSPRETAAFERLVGAMESGHAFGNTVINAPFTVVGGQTAGEQARDTLLALLS